jgi:hypothetical protein
MEKEKQISVIEPAILAQKIFIIRGMKVMVDSDIAELYQTPTMRLNEQVKRNIGRFPSDFMFQLSKLEYENLISQIAISSSEHGGRRRLPYVFTEHGVAMLSSVLRSPRAIQMNIFIIRAFVKIRELISTNKDLARKLEEIERKQSEHDDNLAEIYSIVKQLIDEPIKKVGKVGG